MSLVAFVLVLLAAMCHATWNLAAKRAAQSKHLVWLYSVAGAVVWAPVVFVVGAHLGERPGRALFALLCTGCLHLAYGVGLQRGYRVADLSVVYPIARGTGPLLSSSVAIVFLGERLTPLGGVGALLIVVGIWVLAGGKKLFSGAVDKKGLCWGVLIGSLIASYTINDGWAVRVLGVSPWLVDYSGNCFRALVLAPGALRDRDGLKRELGLYWRHAMIVAVLGTLGYVLVLSAMRTSPISYVAPAREVSMLFAAFFGAKFLKEGDANFRLLGALFMVAGVMLLLTAK